MEVREVIAKAKEAVKGLGLSQVHHVALVQPRPHPRAVFDEHAKFWVSPIENGVEVVSFAKDCPFHPLLQENAHVCFVVDDIDPFVTGQNPVLLEPFAGSLGRAAFIYVNDVVVELMERKKAP